MAFTPAKSEDSGIIANEGYALARVGGPATKVACFDSAVQEALVSLLILLSLDVPAVQPSGEQTYLILTVENRYRWLCWVGWSSGKSYTPTSSSSKAVSLNFGTTDPLEIFGPRSGIIGGIFSYQEPLIG